MSVIAKGKEKRAQSGVVQYGVKILAPTTIVQPILQLGMAHPGCLHLTRAKNRFKNLNSFTNFYS